MQSFVLKARREEIHLEDLDIDDRIIFKLIVGKQILGCLLESGEGPLVGSCEHGNGTSVSIKCSVL